MKKRPAALITGATRGIGKAIADTFASEGCDLILTCKSRRDLLDDQIEQYKKTGVSCAGYLCDVQSFKDVTSLYEKASAEIGQPDIIINNAGISHIGLLTDMSPEEWNAVIGTNLTGIFNVCRIFTPDMIRRQNGCIINISSVWGSAGASCEVAYSASKGGVNSFTKALAKELAPSHVRVNAIAFGAIDTEMNHFLSEEERQALTDEIPACRMGTPEEAARLVWMTANAPEYLTGQIITMDGGWI